MWDPFQRVTRIAEAVDSAPSIFNTRPWHFRPVPPDRVEMRFDPGALGGGDYGPGDLGGRREYDRGRDRWAAPGSLLRPDPLVREEMISCGAALYNLRLAIRVAGHDLAVWMLPDVRRDATLLVSVEIVTGRVKPPEPAEEELYEAIWLRHTSREPYRILPAPLPLLVEMENAAAAEHGWLRVVHPRQARQLLRAAAYAGDVLGGVRPLALPPGKDDGKDDGEGEGETRRRRADIEGRLARFREQRDRVNRVSGDGAGPRPENAAFPPTRRDFWKDPPGRFERWRGLQLMTLSTDDDRPLDWLRAGQALQHALLTATRYSMSVPYGRTARYHAPKRYGLPARRLLPLGPGTEARYGVTVSPLTQLLELEDILREKPRQWPEAWYHRWPWWWYPEVPQMVLRVGYVPVEPLPAPPDPERQTWRTAKPADENDGLSGVATIRSG
jgi:hypothetical protein